MLGAATAVVVPIVGVLATTPNAGAFSSGSSSRLETVMRAPKILRRSRLVGRVSASARIDGALALKPRNERGLERFISSVTTQGSPDFHRYLTPAQFAARFGPAKSTIDAARTALTRDGLRVSGVSRNGMLVSFSASAGQVERAFHTGLARYLLPNGKLGRSTTGAVKLPRSIASKVRMVAGLDNLVHQSPAGLLRATRAEAAKHVAAEAPRVTSVTGAPNACGAASATASIFGGLTDSQIANAYGAFGLYKAGDFGKGQTVAVYELEPFRLSDLKAFDDCYFGSTTGTTMANSVTVTPVDGGQPAGGGSGEAILDVEDVSALAPQASIHVYEAPNTTFGSLDEYNQIISQNTAQVVTTSWGLCEAAVQQGEPGFQQEENALFQEAAAQGQSVFAAAGDSGSNDCNTFETTSPVAPVLSVDDPGSQPYVTSVGGTTINDATQPPNEQVWNDGAAWGAGGGGISSSWVMPSWQRAMGGPVTAESSVLSEAKSVQQHWDSQTTGVQGAPTTSGEDFCQGTPPNGTSGGSAGQLCRTLPDVSAQADEFTGAITIYDADYGGWLTIGGTSSATPIWAAFLADINASTSCTSTKGVGFVTPLLYAVASNPTTYAESFNDITVGNNDVFGLGTTATTGDTPLFAAGTGYDMASGLGSPMLTGPSGQAGLAANLCAMAASTTLPSIASLSPSAVTPSTTSVTVTGSNFESASTDVSAVWINNYELPTADYSVASSTTIDITTLPTESDLQPSYPASDGAGPAVVTVSLNDGETSIVTPKSILDYEDVNGSGTGKPAVTGVSSYGGPLTGGNTVTVFGSGFQSGGTPTVTFGGISAPNVVVASNNELTATVPAYSSTNTTCSKTGSLSGDSASNDLCQVEVVVTNSNGSSMQYSILPAYEGAVSFNANGVLPAPAGCGCEVAPAPSEYDYFPTPTITSISTTSGSPSTYASEGGDNVITVEGTGLNIFGLDWVDMGSVTSAASQDYSLVYDSGTEIQLNPLPISPTATPAALPVTVKTLGGSSNSVDATYAGYPEVTGVSPSYVADTGGTPLTVTGHGLSSAYYAEFSDIYSPFSVGTNYSLSNTSWNSTLRAQQLTVDTVEQNPAIVHTQLCSVTACSRPVPNDELLLYPPGNPSVTSSSPTSGPAHGGTFVTIKGHNLGCVVGVWFGKYRPAELFGNSFALLDCGSTTEVEVKAPPGPAGHKVWITVETVESALTGFGRTKTVSTATFTFKDSSPSKPRITQAAGLRGSSAILRWKPPVSNGGAPVKFYVVRATADGHTKVARLGPAARYHKFSGLFSGISWRLMVTAHNRFGTGLSSVRHVVPKK